MADTNGTHKKIADLEELVCIPDFEKAAEEILPRNTYVYYKSGADDENVLAANKTAYNRLFIKPRALRDVSIRLLNTRILNGPVSFPIGVSPTAMHKLAHPEGELAVAKESHEMAIRHYCSTAPQTLLTELSPVTPNV